MHILSPVFFYLKPRVNFLPTEAKSHVFFLSSPARSSRLQHNTCFNISFPSLDSSLSSFPSYSHFGFSSFGISSVIYFPFIRVPSIHILPCITLCIIYFVKLFLLAFVIYLYICLFNYLSVTYLILYVSSTDIISFSLFHDQFKFFLDLTTRL